MTSSDHSCPEPHVGHRWRSGKDGRYADGWGWIRHRRRPALERRLCRLACLQARRPFAARRPISMTGLPGCMARPRPARLGGWPCGWITAPSICRVANQIKFWGIQPSYAFVADPDQRGVAERFNRTLKEQISMVASTSTSRSCGTPSATSSNSTMPSGSQKNGYLSPAQARHRGMSAISIRPFA